MGPARHLYRFAQRAARAAAPFARGGSSKLVRGLEGRRTAHETLAAWGREGRDPVRPTLWFHAPSVGEGFQARAVIEALRASRDDVQVVFTYFSPSAESLATRMPAEVTAFLPWDLPGPAAHALDALEPDAIVFTKTEVWPELVAAAGERGVPLALIGGAVPPGAGRLRWPVRRLMRETWRALHAVGAIAQADASGFRALGVCSERVRVTGDPGIDSAAGRVGGAPSDAPYLAPFRSPPRPTLVAGSTWPADEERLVPALRRLRVSAPGLRTLIAPHEPDVGHLEALSGRLGAAGFSVATLSEVEAAGEAGEADVVLVDRVGVLAHLYNAGAVAYVGGGFHRHGLHSVLEPAAAGLPVLFGPRHQSARAAGELLDAGGARVARDAEQLAESIARWLADRDAYDYAARSALGYIERHRGAARRSADLVESILRR